MKQDDYILSECNCQDISILETEIEKRFRPKKEQSVLLAGSYKRLGNFKKSERVRDCGSWLEWLERSGECVGVPRSYKLYHANFCRERLCPMCSWRRSYKIFGQMSQIMNYLGNAYRYVFLTLTIPNCEPEDLNKAIDNMLKGWHRLVNRNVFKQAVKGFFRALEVTRNKKNGTYHPHFHIILAVLPSYFNSRASNYITRDEWLRLWQQSMKDDSITQVDVRIMRNKKTGETFGEALNSAVAEAAKYAVKSADYVFKGNNKLMDSIVLTLSSALSYRRLTAFGGVFKDAQAQLGLDDCEDGDLVHVDNNNIREDLATMILRYEWSAGAYKLVKKTQLEIVDGVSVNPENGEVIP